MFKNNDEKIHFYWTNLEAYVELINNNKSPKEAIEIIHRRSISQLGEKLGVGKRAITRYVKKPLVKKSILS